MTKKLIGMLMVAGVLGAAPIVINNTGLTSEGSVDPNWTITSPAGSAFVTVVDGFPIGSPYWLANSAPSKWVQPEGASLNTNTPGTYTYQTTFNLTGFNVATAAIQFRAAVDNQITAVRLNGNVVGFTYGSFTDFSNLFSVSTAAWFNAGVNTLQFDVLNLNVGGNNPSGFRVEISGTADSLTQTPEPATMLMAAPVLIALALRRRRS